MPTVLALHRIIPLDCLSMIISAMGVFVTAISNVIEFKKFERIGAMIAVIEGLWVGVCEVTIPTANDYCFVVSLKA